MVIANDHYQSIGIVCLSVIGAFNVSLVSGRSALIVKQPMGLGLSSLGLTRSRIPRSTFANLLLTKSIYIGTMKFKFLYRPNIINEIRQNNKQLSAQSLRYRLHLSSFFTI